MKKIMCLIVGFFFFVSSTVGYAYEAECINNKGKFSNCKADVDNGILTVSYSSKALKELDRTIRGDQITYIAGGEYARRRVAESVATAVIFAPIFLFMLFAKKKRDNFGIEYVKADGTKDNILIQLPKKYGFAFGQELQTISGKTIVYEGEADTPKDKKADKKAVKAREKEEAAAQAAAGTADGDDQPAKIKSGNKYR